jgi:hypothetical protein
VPTPALRLGINHREGHRLLTFAHIAPVEIGAHDERRRIPVARLEPRLNPGNLAGRETVAPVDEDRASL